MADLGDIIQGYINKNLEELKGKFYFGDLKELSSEQREGETAILLERKDRINGYLVINMKKPFHEVSYSGNDEGFVFEVYPKETTIIVQPYQVTRSEPIHPQAVYKEDWAKKAPFRISIPGDYSEHRRIMEHAAEEFKKDIKTGLWLPTFFKQD